MAKNDSHLSSFEIAALASRNNPDTANCFNVDWNELEAKAARHVKNCPTCSEKISRLTFLRNLPAPDTPYADILINDEYFSLVKNDTYPNLYEIEKLSVLEFKGWMNLDNFPDIEVYMDENQYIIPMLSLQKHAETNKETAAVIPLAAKNRPSKKLKPKLNLSKITSFKDDDIDIEFCFEIKDKRMFLKISPKI